MMLAALVLGVLSQGVDPPLRTTPAYESPRAYLSLPPSFEDRLIYYQSFDSPDGAPEVNVTGAQPAALTVAPGGMRGKCAAGEEGKVVHLASEAFSPHRPLTVSFWWALVRDAPIDGSFGLLHLAGEKGFVSHFSRGKGEWCALQRPAGVLQVYHLPGIQNVNGIYEWDLLARLDLRANVWHHTAVVFRGASLVEVYTDGRLAWKTRTKGRGLTAEDRLHDLALGSRWGTPAALDEVAILQRALSAGEIEAYVTAIRQMAEVGYPE